MSRAFVSEKDGWNYCIKMRETCLYAGENGKCTLSFCKKYGEKPKEKESEKK